MVSLVDEQKKAQKERPWKQLSCKTLLINRINDKKLRKWPTTVGYCNYVLRAFPPNDVRTGARWRMVHTIEKALYIYCLPHALQRASLNHENSMMGIQMKSHFEVIHVPNWNDWIVSWAPPFVPVYIITDATHSWVHNDPFKLLSGIYS